jgi:trk system potassium uptake protein TrkH
VLGTICLLIGGSMIFSLPFAIPALANRTDLDPAVAFETQGAQAFLLSMVICLVVGGVMRLLGIR